MRVGNKLYDCVSMVPTEAPVFPLSGALLLPRAQLPLNIFEPRYIAMIDHALATDRVIGMVQPRFDAGPRDDRTPELCRVGALGRILSFQETGDERYLIQLGGVCRFRIVQELDSALYRRCVIDANEFADDLLETDGEDDVDRDALIAAFKGYLDANDLEADWKSVRSASNEALVNTLAMMSPYGPAEKQALLEAPDLKSRAATLVAITEMEIAKKSGDTPTIN